MSWRERVAETNLTSSRFRRERGRVKLISFHIHSLTHTHCRDGDHGTIHYLNLSGEPQVVNFYWSPEPLQFGDQVEFCVATRSYDKLQLATDISVVQKAKDIHFRVQYEVYIYMFLNERFEGRKKEASKVKQTNKAKRVHVVDLVYACCCMT